VIVLDRRCVMAVLAAAARPITARAQEAPVSDAAGRPVPILPRVARVFPAGPPAAIWLYTLAPDLLLGWPRAIRSEEQVYLLPEVAERPEVGRLTGRGNTANLEAVLASKPDLILDVGSTDATYITTELPDIYTAQAAAIRTSGEILRDMGAKFWDGTEWKLEVANERGDTLFLLRVSAEERPALTDKPPNPPVRPKGSVP